MEWLLVIMCLCAVRVATQIALWACYPLIMSGLNAFQFLLSSANWVWCRTMQHAAMQPEPAPTVRKPSYLELQGVTTRTVDGQTALFGYVDVCGVKIDILVNTQWYNYLPDKILQSRKEEAAVDYSAVSTVAQNKEPPSLVTLQSEDGTHLGVGARVNYRGKSILLTCAHVLAAARRAVGGCLYICKQNRDGVLMRIEMPARATAVFGDIHSSFDAVGLCLDVDGVETPIWSKLGIGAATVKVPATNRSSVTVYGFDKGWRCSTGMATASCEPGSFVHGATTQPGWSGSPLYTSQNSIIGLHKSAHVIGRSNLATILFPIFLKRESEERHRGYSEIQEEEMEMRDNVVDLNISGLGRYRFTATEFHRPIETNEQVEERLRSSGRPLWSDMADDFLAASLDDQYLESGDSLNCQRGSEILPTPSTPVLEPAVPASSCSLPPPQRTPILDMLGASPAISSANPGCVPAQQPQPAPPSCTPARQDQMAQDQLNVPPPQIASALHSQLDQIQSIAGDTIYYAEESHQASLKTHQMLLQQQEDLRLELTHKFAEMASRLEDTIMSKLGSQLACLSTKLDDQMSASVSVQRPVSPPPSRRQRNASQNLTITRGQRGVQQQSSPPSSSRQETTTRYQPRQTSGLPAIGSSSNTPRR